MSRLIEDLTTGLQQAINFERGDASAKVTIYEITPVKKYDNSEIKRVRNQAGMTQTIFADYMGVSKKTVEAWENGRTHPTGSACRLLDILSSDSKMELPFVRVKEA